MAKREYDHWNAMYATGNDHAHRNGFADSVLPIIRAERAVLVADDGADHHGWIFGVADAVSEVNGGFPFRCSRSS